MTAVDAFVRALVEPSPESLDALHGPVGALEDTLELGIGGVPPIFADEAAR